MDTKTVNTIIAFLNAGYTADEIAEIAFKVIIIKNII